MRKVLLSMIIGALFLSSCRTTEEGAFNGAYFGSILGSAIGGISGGRYGHNMGTIVGMATGAAVGAAVGSANESEQKERIEAAHRRIRERDRANDGRYHGNDGGYHGNGGYNAPQGNGGYDDSGFDATNSGDDRLYDFQSSDYTGDYSAAKPVTVMPSESGIKEVSLKGLEYSNAIEIRNARFVDDNGDTQLTGGEQAKIIFEIHNVSDQNLVDIVPTVVETTGNKNILISQSIHVESLPAHRTIRYTAVVLAKSKLKNGTAKFALSVLSNGSAISKVTEFEITTAKKR